MDRMHQAALEAKHAVLEARISNELQRPAPNAAAVATLKKQKLRLKDEMSQS